MDLCIKDIRNSGWRSILKNKGRKTLHMWYVIKVSIGQEYTTIRLCEKFLSNELIRNYFIPKFEYVKKINGEWKKQQSILFPGYLFVETEDVEQLFYTLKQVNKMTVILGVEHEFIPLNMKSGCFLQSIVNEDHVIEMSYGYIKGKKLVITEGALVGQEEKIKKINRHKRTAILRVEMFGDITDITLGLEVVKKLP